MQSRGTKGLLSSHADYVGFPPELLALVNKTNRVCLVDGNKPQRIKKKHEHHSHWKYINFSPHIKRTVPLTK